MPRLKEIFRKDYQPPNFWVTDVELTFELKAEDTVITTRLQLVKNSHTNERSFVLNGTSSSRLTQFQINDRSINIESLTVINHDLHLSELNDDEFTITLTNIVDPANNSALEGLYLSNNIFCSDCEPEGFRNITFFPDRPDIMARYTVTIIADKALCPVLLSNGNLLEACDLDDGLHKTVWHDPYPKPSYLFALVAGDLGYIEGQHIRPDGTPVQLRIYAAHHELDQCHYALGALKRAMEWDEKRFGLICDVNQYNIVAIHDFNGGAMENKGLNIFNAKYVLANSEIATDSDFEIIESIIGHEYFHNWTGNRVTCRDWFQLSLKEGLTVFRDQEFTSDIRHRGLKRIDDVKMLKTYQFPEDAGQLKHPIRPESYVEMRNFYTTTVYEKGAEVVRLYQTLLGTEGFKKGLNHYLAEFDGTAATCDDFLQAMSEANGTDLSGLEYWYSQAGTPHLFISKKILDNGIEISFKQYLTSEGENLQPQWIPIRFALIDSSNTICHEDLFILKSWEDTLFVPCKDTDVSLSLLREFSAPVLLEYAATDHELMQIMYYETDDFARWNAKEFYIANLMASDLSLEEKEHKFCDHFTHFIDKVSLEPSFYALFMTPPEVTFVQNRTDEKDLSKLWSIRETLSQAAVKRFESQFLTIYQKHLIGNTVAHDLKNSVLNYLAKLPHHELTVTKQYESATNMTDRLAALRCSVLNRHSNVKTLLTHFLEKYHDHPSVIDKWFALQASSPYITLEVLNQLRHHSDFNTHNPNRVRSLLASLGQNRVALYQQPLVFYPWLLENIITIDSINPQVAARLATPFSQLTFLKAEDKNTILTMIKANISPNLSTNLAEQLSKSL